MTLKNKLNIENQIELARVEEKISKQKAIQLWISGDLKNFRAGSFESLKFIHEKLFEDIYFFAGKIRDVNISKGNLKILKKCRKKILRKLLKNMLK